MSIAEVRTILRSSARARRRPSATDVYAAIVLLGLGGLELYSLLSAPARSFGAFATPASALWAGATLEPALGGTALTIAAVAGFYGLLRRIGPTLVSRAQLGWLLPLPIDRRGLLAPSLARTLLATVLVAGPISALFASALFGVASPLLVALAAGAGIVLAALLVGLSSAVQMASAPFTRSADAVARVTGPLTLLALLLAQLSATLVGWPSPGLPPVRLPSGELAAVVGLDGGAASAAVLLLLLAAGGLLVLSFRRLGRLGSAALRRSAGTAGELWSALLSMSLPPADTEVWQARAARSTGSTGQAHAVGAARAPSGGRMRARLRVMFGPAGALVSAQFLVWWRTSGALPVLLSSAIVPAALLAIPVLNLRWVLVVILLVSGLRAVTAVSGSGRLMAENGALGRLLPIAEHVQRRLFGILPALILTPWAFVTLGLLVMAAAAPVAILWLAVPLAVGLAGSTVRSAFRPDPDWSAAGIPTEMGIIPTGWFISALHGRTATAVVLTPVLVALATASVTPTLVAAQLLLSAAIAWHGTRA